MIVNEAAARRHDPFAGKVLEQADVMRDQVAHHLERARIAARVTVVGTVTEVAPVIEALRRTMEKIHRDRGIAIDAEGRSAAKFRGERQDLEEMVGNLVDNACKWAASQVFIEVLVEPPAEPGAGPSAADHRRSTTAAGCPTPSAPRWRGAASGWTNPSPARGSACRSWSISPRLYGGSLSLGDAPIGGLRAELVPARADYLGLKGGTGHCPGLISHS